MKKVIATVLSIAVLGGSASTSFADSNRRPDSRDKDRRIEQIEKKARDDKKKKDKEAIAAGIIGLAAGAIIGGAMLNNNAPTVAPVAPAYPPQPTYHPQRPYFDRYEHQRQRYRDTRYYNSKQWGAPFSPEWYRYCASEHRSFDPKTGTYRARNGKVQFCEIPDHIRGGRR